MRQALYFEKWPFPSSSMLFRCPQPIPKFFKVALNNDSSYLHLFWCTYSFSSSLAFLIFFSIWPTSNWSSFFLLTPIAVCAWHIFSLFISNGFFAITSPKSAFLSSTAFSATLIPACNNSKSLSKRLHASLLSFYFAFSRSASSIFCFLSISCSNFWASRKATSELLAPLQEVNKSLDKSIFRWPPLKIRTSLMKRRAISVSSLVE